MSLPFRIPQLNISTSSPPRSPSSGFGNGLRVKVEPLSPREPPNYSINRVAQSMQHQHNLSRPHSTHSVGLSPVHAGGIHQPLSPGITQAGNSSEVRNHHHSQQQQPLHLSMQQQQQHFNDNCNPMPLQKRLRVSTESVGSGGVWSS